MEEKNDKTQAVLLYLLSQNVEEIVEIYFEELQELKSNKQVYAVELASRLERLLAMIVLFNFRLRSNKFDLMIYQLSRVAYEQQDIRICYQLLEFTKSSNPIISVF